MICDVVLIVFVWLVISVAWFWRLMGRKNDPGHWYDYVLCAPLAAVILTIVAFRPKKV